MNDPKKTPEEPQGAPLKIKKNKSYGFFKKKRGGVPLTREQVKSIKEGRKKLRAELKKQGEKSRKEFELTASSVGLYFDHNKIIAGIKWFFANKGLKFLALLAGVLLLVLWGLSAIADMKGHFTINMSSNMFRQGFSISEDEDFTVRTSRLFATPKVNVPCLSIVDIPENVDDIKGEHEGNYFAYTFYLRNEGETDADYKWELRFAAPTKLSKTAWIMLFIDGEMTLYAQANEDGSPAALPERGNDTVGYLKPPLMDVAADKSQYEIIRQYNTLTYWRVIPKPFLSDELATAGERLNVHPGEVHKYTVVVWLEGDDPDCTQEMVNESLGLEMFMAMIDEKAQGE